MKENELPVSLLQMLETLNFNPRPRNPEQAQDLVYSAWECENEEETFELLFEALKFDPGNIDAWLGLLEYNELSQEEEIKFLRRLLEIGEKNLGKEVFEKNKGKFWGLLETRPYMRARSMLADRLLKAGMLEEAIAEHEAMLELNPNDNQGIRYGLMSLYLAQNRLEECQKLFRQYQEYTACWLWASVLERYLNGDMPGAEKALAKAEKQNRYAKDYFTGKRNPPNRLPDSYSPGSKEEAVIAWEMLKIAWQKHPESRSWLRAQRPRK